MSEIALSIVSGTYNRLSHLKNMVQSVRTSIGVGIPYEIVLVDGGSTDSTIEWCKSQDNIVLIEQGELLGAVRAFNTGFEQARGKYVIAANDDIVFVDESLLCALVFMEDNPDVGCGCFWQDRGGKSWHIEYQPAIVDGKQVSHIYGQVAIYPRWLGNMVGWWGQYLHTYGGDNELTSHILEMGYKVRAVPCACIHDTQVEDELRKINNAAYKDPASAAGGGKSNTDSTTWGLKWTRNNRMCGPIVALSPTVPNPLEKGLRIFYIPIYEQGHPVQKRQKMGLRDALSEIGLVYEYDYTGVYNDKGAKYSVDLTFDLADVYKPDMFVFQVQSLEVYTADVIEELKREHPNAIFINWNGDYKPHNLLDVQYMALLKQFHLTGLVTTQIMDAYRVQGIPWFYWQIGYEESDAPPDGTTRDIVFLGNGYSDYRYALADFLGTMKEDGYSVGLYGSWPERYKPDGSTLYDFDAGCSLYRSALFAISDNQWGMEATGFVSNRLFQAMAAGGALFLQQHFDGMEELLGLRDGEHLVAWYDFDDLRSKIEYFMDHTDERVKIVREGTKEVLENHSFDVRVMELLDEMRVRGLWNLSP